MRPARSLLALSLLGIALSAAGPTAESKAEFRQLGPDLRVELVVPGVWRHVSTKVQPGWGAVPANGLIVVGREAAALIDTPWTDEHTALLFEFVEQKYGVKIAHVVATHSHADCTGGLAEAHERGAESYAFELTAEFAKAAGEPLPRTTFADAYAFSLGEVAVELRYFGGGHTRDNIVAWLPRQQLLFGGCLVKRKGASKGYVAEADLAAWPGTIRKVMAAYPEMQIVVPGHGPPGAVEYLDYTIELVEGLAGQK